MLIVEWSRNAQSASSFKEQNSRLLANLEALQQQHAQMGEAQARQDSVMREIKVAAIYCWAARLYPDYLFDVLKRTLHLTIAAGPRSRA